MEPKFKKNVWIELQQIISPKKARIVGVSKMRRDTERYTINTVSDPELISAGFDTTGDLYYVFRFNVTYNINGENKIEKISTGKHSAALRKYESSLKHMQYNLAKQAERGA